jgi:hypothetical protein
MSRRKIKVVPLEQTIEAPQVESIVDPAPKEDTPDHLLKIHDQ